MKTTIHIKNTFVIFLFFITTTFAQFAGGTYTIGTGGGENYSSLLSACAALNSAGTLAGDVIFEITTDLTEAANIPLGVNTSGFSITFRPSADADRIVTFTQATKNNGPSGSFVIGTTTLADFTGLTQTDNVVIDGYASGGSTKRLTFTTSSSTSHINNSPITVIGNSNFITIKNCIVTHSPKPLSGYPTNFAIGLYTYYNAGGTLTPDNITVDNCDLTALSSYSAAFGTYWAGSSSISVLPSNCVIKNNTITAGFAGINLSYCGAIDIYNNTFSIDQTSHNASDGIYVNNVMVYFSGTTNIYNNNFIKLRSLETSDSYPSYYIRLVSHNGIHINIYNNLMSGFSRPISSSGVIGIYGIATSGADVNNSVRVIYNTILMNDLGSTGGDFEYIGILFNGNSEETISNNIISIQESGFDAFAMKQANPNLTGEDPNADYNLVYLGTGTAKWGKSLGNFTTLADWQAGTSLDVNSISANPLFASETNLKPSIGSPALSAGTPIAGITTDYEGVVRSGTNPSIGAFENGQLPVAVDWCNLHLPQNASISEGGSPVTIYARVYEPGVTPGAGQGADIECWIGWNDADTDPSTWSNWTIAAYNTDAGDNDEYMAEIGDGLSEGTYYYASRFRKTESTVGSYQYGGYSSGGGNFWDGATYVSGGLTVNQSTPPYFQNFDGAEPLTLPISWFVEDTNNDLKPWRNRDLMPRSDPNAMTYLYSSTNAADDWLFSPAFNLTASTTYEVTFWYRADNSNLPEKLEVKWGTTQNSAGMTSSAIFDNSNINNTTYQKGTGEFTPGSSGTYYIGWHCYSAAFQGLLYIDDISVTVKPVATNNQTIPANTAPVTFTGTGTTVQFTLANTGDLNLTVDKINSAPGGTPPGGLINIAPQYWKVTIESGLVDGTYSITLDISDVASVNNPATLHLLKRDDASKIWTDYGVASSIVGNLLTWTGFTSFSEFGLGGDGANPLPVELTSFTASISDHKVILNWQTATEVNNYGFEIERASTGSATGQTSNVKSENWEKIGFVKGHGNSMSVKEYLFVDGNVSNGKVSYRLKQIDNDGGFSYSEAVEVKVDYIPTEFALFQNYPNPFNPATQIEFSLPAVTRVLLEVFNILGEKVVTLVNEEKAAGSYKVEFSGKGLTSGIYFYRLKAGEFVQTKKFVLMK